MGTSTEASVRIEQAAEVLFAMVADITRMGEWSSACVGGRWEGDGDPGIGSRFVGENKVGEHSYETRSEIVEFEGPHRISWVTGGVAKWTWQFSPCGDATDVTESWELVGHSPVVEAMGVERATANSAKNIEATLERFKTVAEAQSIGG